MQTKKIKKEIILIFGILIVCMFMPSCKSLEDAAYTGEPEIEDISHLIDMNYENKTRIWAYARNYEDSFSSLAKKYSSTLLTREVQKNLEIALNQAGYTFDDLLNMALSMSVKLDTLLQKIIGSNYNIVLAAYMANMANEESLLKALDLKPEETAFNDLLELADNTNHDFETVVQVIAKEKNPQETFEILRTLDSEQAEKLIGLLDEEQIEIEQLEKLASDQKIEIEELLKNDNIQDYIKLQEEPEAQKIKSEETFIQEFFTEATETKKPAEKAGDNVSNNIETTIDIQKQEKEKNAKEELNATIEKDSPADEKTVFVTVWENPKEKQEEQEKFDTTKFENALNNMQKNISGKGIEEDIFEKIPLYAAIMIIVIVIGITAKIVLIYFSPEKKEQKIKPSDICNDIEDTKQEIVLNIGGEESTKQEEKRDSNEEPF